MGHSVASRPTEFRVILMTVETFCRHHLRSITSLALERLCRLRRRQFHHLRHPITRTHLVEVTQAYVRLRSNSSSNNRPPIFTRRTQQHPEARHFRIHHQSHLVSYLTHIMQCMNVTQVATVVSDLLRHRRHPRAEITATRCRHHHHLLHQSTVIPPTWKILRLQLHVDNLIQLILGTRPHGPRLIPSTTTIITILQPQLLRQCRQWIPFT